MEVVNVKYLLMAQDMDRAVAFYRDVIGLTLKLQSPWWSELTHGDAIVALHGGGSGERNRTGLGFQVTDIEVACAEATAGGATLEKGPEDRPEEGIKLADLVDPEGNTFMLSQSTR